MRTSTTQPGKCLGCRGRGWKFRRSRRSWVIGTLARGQAQCARRTCPDCQGTGQARQPG